MAEALNQLPVAAAARVVAALPFELAVQLLDEPELDRRGDVFELLDESRAIPLIEALASDQQVDLFRTLQDGGPRPPLPRAGRATREALKLLLPSRRTSAGGTHDHGVRRRPGHLDGRSGAPPRERGRRARRRSTRSTCWTRATSAWSRRVAAGAHAGRAPAARARQLGSARTDHRRRRTPTARTWPGSSPSTTCSPCRCVDDAGRVLGIVTVDDVIDALVSEQTEDVQKFGGMAALDEPYTADRLRPMVRKRAGWLCALFLGEMLTATAMRHFEDEIARAVVLALFIPLIISSGGNSGSQATSLIIRAMALREVALSDWWRVAMRELPAGLALGAILGRRSASCASCSGSSSAGTTTAPHWLLVALTVALSLVGVVHVRLAGRLDAALRARGWASTRRARRRRSWPRWWM